jgi:hypothetical protein
VLRRIDWSTPANILEKIIQYEAVHEIHDWDDLKRRLDPVDRRCFAFFHPALAEEPLIFVEVALTDGGAPSVQALLSEERSRPRADRPTTAIFYSISNCQAGSPASASAIFSSSRWSTIWPTSSPSSRTSSRCRRCPASWRGCTLAGSGERVAGAGNPQAAGAARRPGWVDDAAARDALGEP